MLTMRASPTLAALLVLALSSLATAQQPTAPPPPAQAAEARRLFERGLELADEERWGEAVESFRQSRALFERPSTVFNLANALFRVGRMTEAIATFDAYLAIANPRRDRTQIAEANRLRGVAQTSLATLVLDVSPPDARVTIDGQPNAATGARREIAVDPGRHELRVTADDHEPYTTPVTVSAGARSDLAIRLARVAPPPPDTPPPPPTPTPGRLLVRTAVRGASVRASGEAMTAGEPFELPAGPHDVVVTARGHRRFERTVQIEPGELTTLDVRLVRD
ncbi:MAG: PEGA domain-containing protein, partial [Deltaproteobacteria bacterium]|nr:PEGA domain-containing protein [Deltaproteobacteria bacterium]